MARRIGVPGGIQDLQHLHAAALETAAAIYDMRRSAASARSADNTGGTASSAEALPAASQVNSTGVNSSCSNGTSISSILHPAPVPEDLDDVLKGLQKLMASSMFSIGDEWYGQKGLSKTLERYTPQMFAGDTPYQQQPGTIWSTVPPDGQLQPGTSYDVTYEHFHAVEEPQQLLELMPYSQAFRRAQHKLLCYMATEGVVCKQTLPKWEVFLKAQELQMEQLEERGDFGGFLAANHKAWMVMWERGLAPDSFEGLVDISIWIPAMLQSMGLAVCSNDSSDSGPAGGGDDVGSGLRDSSKPAGSRKQRRRRRGCGQGPAV